MTEFLLLFSFILLLIIAYVLFDGELTSPSLIYCAMYTFAVGCAYINKSYWKMNISLKTYLILIFGAVMFIAIDLLFKRVFRRKREVSKPQKIEVENSVLNLSIIIGVTITLCWIYSVIFFSQKYGGGTIGSILEIYRLKTSYGEERAVSGLVMQLYKIVCVEGYIYGFIIANNLAVEGKKIVREWKYFFPIILYLAISFFSSNRLNLLTLAGAMFTYYYLIRCAIQYNNRKSIKFILKMIVFFLLLLTLFYAIRLAVGRSGSKNTNLIRYISMYAGGSIELFDIFLLNPRHSEFWGKETFVSLIGNFRKLGLCSVPEYIAHKEFRKSASGVDVGNVYTAFRRWYADFGIEGVIILQFIFITFYSLYYHRMLSKDYSKTKYRYQFIIYGYMSAAVFMHCIDDQFYETFVCFGFVIYLVIFRIMVYWILEKKRIRIRMKK